MKNGHTQYPARLQVLIPQNTPVLETQWMPKGVTADKIRAVFHQMYIVRSKQSRLDEKDRPIYYQDNYVPLNAKIMLSILSKPYRRTLNWMVKQNLIEIYSSTTSDRSYIPGKRPMLYKINPNLLTPNVQGKHFRVEYITRHTLIKAIWKNHFRYGCDDLKLAEINPVLPELRKMCAAAYFLSDAAWQWMIESASDDIKPIHRSLLFFQMELHNSGELVDFFIDPFGFRAHTCFSSLKKELRQFIRFRGFDNETPVLIDLGSSQPYFISSVINKNPSLLERFLPEFMPLKGIIDEGVNDPGAKFFHRTCSEGLLYRDWLLSRGYLKDEKLDPTDEQKKIAKKEILGIVMYGPVGNYAPTKKEAYDKKMTKLMFEQRFGKTWEIIAAIKSVGADVLPFMDKFYYNKEGKYVGKTAAHKNLSAMMQRLESRILLFYIGQRLIDKGIAPFVTIHDCFVTPASVAEAAKKEILEAFLELGLRPPFLHLNSADKC